jgi:exonuclease VII small subunit
MHFGRKTDTPAPAGNTGSTLGRTQVRDASASDAIAMTTPRPAMPPPRGPAIEHSVLVERTQARLREQEKNRPVNSGKSAAQVSGDRRQGDGGERKPGALNQALRWIRKRPNTGTSKIWGIGYAKSTERGVRIGLSQAEKIKAESRQELLASSRLLAKRVDAVLDTSLEKHPDFNSRPGRAPISDRKRDWPRRVLTRAKTLKQLLKEDPNYAIRGSVGRNEASLNKSVGQREVLLNKMLADKDRLEQTQNDFERAHTSFTEVDQQLRAAQSTLQNAQATLADAKKPAPAATGPDVAEVEGSGHESERGSITAAPLATTEERQAALVRAEQDVATSRAQFERLGALRTTRLAHMETQERALDDAINTLHNSSTLCNDLGASENALSVDLLNSKIKFLKELAEQHGARLERVKNDNEAMLTEMVGQRVELETTRTLAATGKTAADLELDEYTDKITELQAAIDAHPPDDPRAEQATQQLRLVNDSLPGLQQKVSDAARDLDEATQAVAHHDAKRDAIDAQQADLADVKRELDVSTGPLIEKAREWQLKTDKTLELEVRRHDQAVDALVLTPPGFSGKDIASVGGTALKDQMKLIAGKLPLEDPQAEREMPRLAKLEIISRAVASVTKKDPARSAQLMTELLSRPSAEWTPLPARPGHAPDEPDRDTRPAAVPSAELRALFHKMADVPRGIELLNEIAARVKPPETKEDGKTESAPDIGPVGERAAAEREERPKLDTMGRAQLQALHAYWKADKAHADESDPAVREWLRKAQTVATHTMRFDKKKPETAEFEGKEFLTDERVAYAAVSKGFLSNATGSHFDTISKSLEKVSGEWLEAAKDTRNKHLQRLPNPTIRPYKFRTPFDRAMLKLANRQLEAQGMPSVKTVAHANIAQIARTLSDKLALGGMRSGPIQEAAPLHDDLERANLDLAAARREEDEARTLAPAHAERARRAEALVVAAKAHAGVGEIAAADDRAPLAAEHAQAAAAYKVADAAVKFAEAAKVQRTAAAAAAAADKLSAAAAQKLAKAELLAEAAPDAVQALAQAPAAGLPLVSPANAARDTAREEAKTAAALAAARHEEARTALADVDLHRTALNTARGELAAPAELAVPDRAQVQALETQAETAARGRDDAATQLTTATQRLRLAETARTDAAGALATPSGREQDAIRFDAATQVICDYIARQQNEVTKAEPLTATLPKGLLQRSTTQFQRTGRLYKAELSKRDVAAMRLEVQARFAQFEQEQDSPAAGTGIGPVQPARGRTPLPAMPEPYETLFREVENAPSGVEKMLGQGARPAALTPQRLLAEIGNRIDGLDQRGRDSLQWDTLKTELAVDQIGESVTVARRKQLESAEHMIDFYKPMVKELRLRNQLIMTAGGEMGGGIPLLPLSPPSGGVVNLNANLFSYRKDASFQVKSPTYGLELIVGDTVTKSSDLKLTGGFNGLHVGPIRFTTPSVSVKGDHSRGKQLFTTLRILRGKDDQGVREEQKARDAGVELLETLVRWNEDGQHPVPGQRFGSALEAILAKHPDVLIADGEKKLAGNGLTGEINVALRAGVGGGAFSVGPGVTLAGKAEWAREVSKERSGYAHQVVRDISSQFRTRLTLSGGLAGLNGVPQARVPVDGVDPDNGATRFYAPLNFADFSREMSYRLEKNGATRFAIGDQTGGSLDRAYGSAKEVLAEIEAHQEEFYMRFLDTVAAGKGEQRDTEENRMLAAKQLNQFKLDLVEASKYPNLQYNIKYEMQPRMSGWGDGHNALETLAMMDGDLPLANQQREARGRLSVANSTWAFKNCAIRNKGKDSSDLGIDFIWRRLAKRSAETSSAVSAFPA